MWVYLALVAGVLFAAAAIFSPIIWFLFPAVALFALAFAVLLGGAGGAQEAAKDDADAGPGQRAVVPDEGSIEDPDARRPAHVATGFAHEGQEPGH